MAAGSHSSQRWWLALTNISTAAGWARVLLIVAMHGLTSLTSEESEVCQNVLGPAVKVALWVSFFELLNCLIGLTRSHPAAVALFSCTRFGVELLVAPLIPCGSWQHLLTVTVWSLGDTVRFGCFAIDGLYPGIHMVKSIRFTVGPILFPIGALGGEMMMVIRAGSDLNRPMLYVAAALWPVFFYPMMQQLLRQRRKHFQSKTKKKEIKAV